MPPLPRTDLIVVDIREAQAPYPASTLKRLGDYPTNLVLEATPITTTLPE
jgi:hypothetical protein